MYTYWAKYKAYFNLLPFKKQKSFRYIASKYKKQDWTGLTMSTVFLRVYISTINV